MIKISQKYQKLAILSIKKSLETVSLLYQSIAFYLVEMTGLEPVYVTQFNLLSTCLVKSNFSLALSEMTNQRLTTPY